jgi:hypothetical protein
MRIGFVYKIIDNTNGNVYYGSTIKPAVSHRISNHKDDYNRYLAGKRGYCKSGDIIKNGDYSYTTLEKHEAETKEEIREIVFLREQYYILNNECINVKVPLRSRKELYAMDFNDVKTKQSAYGKEYITCSCGLEIKRSNKSTHLKSEKHKNRLK